MFVKKSNLLEQVYDIIVTKQPKEESCPRSQILCVSWYTLIFTFLFYIFFAFASYPNFIFTFSWETRQICFDFLKVFTAPSGVSRWVGGSSLGVVDWS